MLFSSYVVLLLVWLGGWSIDARAQTVRLQMHAAPAQLRNQAFSHFFAQHGVDCSVSKSAFATAFKKGRLHGDVWWTQCTVGTSFAVFIANDAESTSWYLPCKRVRQVSNLRCFEAIPKEVVLR